jgi:hypothetical protein
VILSAALVGHSGPRSEVECLQNSLEHACGEFYLNDVWTAHMRCRQGSPPSTSIPSTTRELGVLARITNTSSFSLERNLRPISQADNTADYGVKERHATSSSSSSSIYDVLTIFGFCRLSVLQKLCARVQWLTHGIAEKFN